MKYYLTKNGGTMTEAREMGLSFTGLELQNMQADRASLRWTRRRASEACALAHNDTVEIFADARRIFRGRARLGSVTSEGMGIQIVGPWSHLDEQIYQLSLLLGSFGTPGGRVLGQTFTETWPMGTEIWTGTEWDALDANHTITWTVSTYASYAGYPATTGTVDVNMAWASRCWLFRPGGTLGQVYTTLQDEWSRVMNFMAVTNNPDVFSVGSVQLGGLIAPRARTIADQPVSEVLRQVLAMKPDAAVWWDYSGSGVPSIQARVASLETPLELGIGQQVLSGYQLKVTDDLVPSGVVVRWERELSGAGSMNTSVTGLGRPYLADYYPGSVGLTNCSYSNGSTVVTTDSTAGLEVGMRVTGFYLPAAATVGTIISSTSFTLSASVSSIPTPPGSTTKQVLRAFSTTAGAASHQPGVMLHTVTDNMDYIPGIAHQVYQSLAVLRAQGSLTVVDRDFTLGLRPGMVIRLSGDPQLTGIQLWVQSVSWDPASGMAQLTVGYPAHLQLRDRVDLKGWFRVSFTGVFGEVSSWIVPPP
ncbi:hypothetical protein [Brevifollis gellanilyticus]|uniref:Uncharacterized protein n=1 Tax=Brevifollis gellanilyticus TaxID=748831 RepID=A0A512MHH0_9BACT|nr:hypothetical protein [Brevifollis gellanilyticus]GEP46180.1 hypothetical protein BGE01nite_54710 [Brevifollis gellanilyticus]